MAKADLQALANMNLDAAKALKDAIDALPDDSELQKKIDELLLQVASLQADLDAKNAALQLDEEKISKAKADLA